MNHNTVEARCGLVLCCWTMLAVAAVRGDSYTIPMRVGFNLIANQLDAGSNTLNDVLLNDGTLEASSIFFYPGRFAPEQQWEPCGVHFIFTDNCIAYGSADKLAFYDEFAEEWIAEAAEPTRPWRPRVGLMLLYAGYDARVTNYTFRGNPRVESGTPIELTAGGCCLLSRETAGVGTYENIVGKPPTEGHQVVRLKPGALPTSWAHATDFHSSLPWCFDASNLFIHTFTNGVWVPSPPQLDVGEAAWFCAPPPLLKLTVTNTDIVLSWPVASIDLTLESTSQMAESNLWIAASGPMTTNDTRRTVTLPLAADGTRFFRLKRSL